ncbi:hypothetical protein LshimejAT787_1302530 [Lyophyllum shimeji]|uniref:Uncharacterized protein n=1 Tax=Lyophyllum shimeji TaxID=47721 RepID=A0A9P3PY31_LYOSH|nr:hypothetical protein LshimejAT787_1302530 [Lyophyllum shimeji]
MASSDSKTAEFARLFDLFERLASRKPRTCTDENNMDDVRSMPVPADLAPVVNSLASLVGARKYEASTKQKKKAGGRTRRNTIAASSRNTHDMNSDDEDEESLAKFPLGKKYPFTFKLMLHKLYQLDDWAQKVKDVLEKSQMEYKPLHERVEEKRPAKDQEEEEPKKQDGRVHFKTGAVPGSRRPTVRPRSHSVVALGKGRDVIPPNHSPKSPRPRAPVKEDIRVVKKRCVGRRKSLSGPLSSEMGRIGGGWVYDAAVASAEFAGRREATERSGVQTQKYPSMGVRPNQVGGKRRVSLGTPSPGCEPENTDSGIARRRRALSVMNKEAPGQSQRKRPLEF